MIARCHHHLHQTRPRPRLPALLLCAAAATFDSTLSGMLASSEHLGADAAVSEWLSELDGRFVTLLGARIEAAAGRGDDYESLLDLLDAIDRAHQPASDKPAIDMLLAAHWPEEGGFLLDEAEADEIDQQADDHASTYGEVTTRGARVLFEAIGLPEAEGAVFFDLGSGVGRLVAQAYLEFPKERLARAVGVELSPSRHALAVRGRASMLTSSKCSDSVPLFAETARDADGGRAFELRCCSMLDAGLDLSTATHVYVASLCMSDELLDALWARLQSDAPRLRAVASLREFSAPPAPACTEIAEVDMTWNGEGEPGTLIYVYTVGGKST